VRGWPAEPSRVEVEGADFEAPDPMAKVGVFTKEQIGQFRAQLRRMLLLGRRLGVKLQRSIVARIFLDQVSHRLQLGVFLPKSGAISHKNSHISPGISHRYRTTRRIYVDISSLFSRDWKGGYRPI
jgi:hypothetical protein